MWRHGPASLFGALVFLSVIGGSIPANAERVLPKGSIVMDAQKWKYNQRPGYFGVELRPMFCMHNCRGTGVVTYGPDFGYKYIGAGFRYGYSDHTHWLIPDLRVMYPIVLGRRFAIEPLLEISPIYWMKTSGGTVKVFQLVLRPGLRIRFQVTPEFNIYLEPVLLDFVVHSWIWRSGKASGGLPSNGFAMSYEFGFGLQYRFR